MVFTFLAATGVVSSSVATTLPVLGMCVLATGRVLFDNGTMLVRACFERGIKFKLPLELSVLPNFPVLSLSSFVWICGRIFLSSVNLIIPFYLSTGTITKGGLCPRRTSVIPVWKGTRVIWNHSPTLIHLHGVSVILGVACRVDCLYFNEQDYYSYHTGTQLHLFQYLWSSLLNKKSTPLSICRMPLQAY